MQGEEEKGSSGSIYGTAGKKHETQVYLQHHMHAQREGTGQRNKREKWRYLDTRHGDLPTKLQARQYLRNGILYIRVHVLPHTYAHALLHNMHMHSLLYTCPHTYIYTHMHTHLQHICTRTSTHMHTHLHTCAHAPPHTYVHTPMHLHTDTHTNKNEGESQRAPDHLVDSWMTLFFAFGLRDTN